MSADRYYFDEKGMDLRGKVALITGAAQGLGRGFAEAILEAGGKVSVLDILEEMGSATARDLSKKYGDATCMFLKCDVTNKEEIKDCFQKTTDLFGRIDIVVNNAAILPVDHAVDDKMFDVNVKGVVNGTYTAMDYLRKDKGGSGGAIVNMGSNAALQLMNSEGIVTYTASKCAVIGFTRSLALSIGDPSTTGHGVKVVCLCPGAVRTYQSDNLKKLDAKCRAIIEKTGTMEVSDVVPGFIKLLTDENNSGGVLLVEKDVMTYHYPAHFKTDHD